jgi:D-alanine-D-alanine ligase
MICGALLDRFRQPVLVEAFLPGKEITVGVVGSGSDARVIGMMEVIFDRSGSNDIYSFENKADYEQFIRYGSVPEPLYSLCEKVALDSWRGLGCRDGGRVDIRLDENGVPNFMEVNPLPGLNPVHSDLPILARMARISFQQLIELILEAALQRLDSMPGIPEYRERHLSNYGT